MKMLSYRSFALAAALVLLAVLPLAAADPGRRVDPGPDILAFFEQRGVDPQYVGKPQAEVPIEQWRKMVRIVNSVDFDNDHSDYTDYENDHDMLNTLVSSQLLAEPYGIGKPVYMSIGGIVWSVEKEEDD